MLAIVAAIVFFLAVFGVKLGELNVVALGLAIMALHFVVPLGDTYIKRIRSPRE